MNLARSAWLAAGLLALLPSARLAWTARDMPHLGRVGDDGLYYVSAKSLAQGTGHRILSLPDQPYQTKYPPLYPMVLSAVWRINPNFPDNLTLATLFAWLMLPAFLIVARLLFRELELRPTHAWVLTLLLALNPAVVLLSYSLLSELMFACLLLPAVILAERATKPTGNSWIAACAGLLAGAAYLTRTAGIAMAVTAPVCFLLRRRHRQALLFLLGMLPAVAGWYFWVRLHSAPASDEVSVYYTDYVRYYFSNVSWADLPALVWNNAEGVFSGIGGLIIANVTGSAWIRILSWTLVILSIAGIVRLTRRTGACQHLFFGAGFLLLLIIWNFPPHERYVVPVFPLLLAGLSVEVLHIVRMTRANLQSSDPARRIVAGLVSASLTAAACFAIFLTWQALVSYLPRFTESERKQLADNRSAYAWISQNLPQDSTLLAHHDSTAYLYSGRQSCRLVLPSMLYYRREQERFLGPFRSLADFALKHKLSHLLLTAGDFYSTDLPENGRDMVRRMVEGAGDFRLLYSSPTVSLYRIEPRHERP